MEVSVTKIDESGPPIESDPDCRSNVRVTRSSTLREVEVKGKFLIIKFLYSRIFSYLFFLKVMMRKR